MTPTASFGPRLAADVRITFLGTPPFAVPTLSALVAAGHEIAAVYTRAPKPGGRRGLEPTRTPVHAIADDHGFAVRTPLTLKGEEAARAFASLDPDVAVVVGYGLLLPPAILTIPRHGCLNLHPSILPRWRGAAPIQRPIMAGDGETAAAVMLMDEGLDTGPVALEARVAIPLDATAGDMHDVLAERGARLMTDAIGRLAAGELTFQEQPQQGVVYATKIDKAEARIDWSKPAQQVHNSIRGLSPTPGAFFEVDLGRGSERLKVLRSALTDETGVPGEHLDGRGTIACGCGSVKLLEIQRAGKAPMLFDAFSRGTRLPSRVG